LKKNLIKNKELHKRKSLFNSKYPNIIFENLKLQNNNIETDDSSTHYLDIIPLIFKWKNNNFK